MFFKFFENKNKNVQKNIEIGCLVKIKNSASISGDKSYFIVINHIKDEHLSLNDQFDDCGMVGIIWGVNEDFYLEEMKRELHFRLWNPELYKFLILSCNSNDFLYSASVAFL